MEICFDYRFFHFSEDVWHHDQVQLSHVNRRFRINILFLKTHKTGSSTVQNILLRFALRFSLDVLLPEKNNYIAYDQPLHNKTLTGKSVPVDGKFNIFTCHSRYHPNTMNFMYDDTIRVTLLRNSSEHFESLYNFYHLDRRYKLSLEDLLRSPNKSSFSFARGGVGDKSTNQMCHDLGLTAGQLDDSTIQAFIDYIDKEFDFVMITEYLDECLILLADLMGWSLKYVSYLPLMTRPAAKKSNLTYADKMYLRELNRADSLIYDHFTEKFRQRVLRYGLKPLLRDLKTLHSLNDELYAKCISKETTKGYAGTVAYVLNSNYDWECTYAAKQELKFIDEIREKQKIRFEREKKLLDLFSN